MIGAGGVYAKDSMKALCLFALVEHDPERIVKTAGAVKYIIDRVRRESPEIVPTKKQGAGLLSMPPYQDVPVDDFALALWLSDQGFFASVRAQLGDVDPIIAFLSDVAMSDDESPSWIDAATNYVAWHCGASLSSRAEELRKEAQRLSPLADHGKRFTGKKAGSLGPIAKRIKAYLVKKPSAKPDEVWAALKKAPPKGHELMESDRFGRYIECGAKTVMEWPRFRNLVSEHRPKK